MNVPKSSALPADFAIDHVELSVADLDASVARWTGSYRFAVAGHAGSPGQGYRRAALRQGSISLVVTQGIARDHPASAYVAAHGDGVSNIALRTGDTRAAFDHAVRNGARPIAPPGLQGDAVCATLSAWGDVVHTLVQRPEGTAGGLPPGFAPPDRTAADRAGANVIVAGEDGEDRALLQGIDHIAVCAGAGELDQLTGYYQRCFGFEEIFEEHIVVGSQAMNSKVVQSSSRGVTFTILEPDVTAQPGQIDQFIKDNDGPGVQHLAFTTDDAVLAVRELSARGVEFLTTPDAYYDVLGERITPIGHLIGELRDTNLLVDQDPGGQLFQIFTRSTHERGTLFYEVIERVGATTFGSANIKALYEAVELEQSRAAGRSRYAGS